MLASHSHRIFLDQCLKIHYTMHALIMRRLGQKNNNVGYTPQIERLNHSPSCRNN